VFPKDTVKALRIMPEHPIQADLTAEDRAKLRRITEMIEKMESRITVLETLDWDRRLRRP
jgi:hypothetical protein